MNEPFTKLSSSTEIVYEAGVYETEIVTFPSGIMNLLSVTTTGVSPNITVYVAS